MLYVTTRNHRNAFTSHHVIVESRGADGGLYVPLNLPKLTEQELQRFFKFSFGQCVAEMLNLFFSTKLTSWDVDFSIGRYPVRLEQLANRIYMAETWHNPDWQYQRIENNLRDLLQTEADLPGNWISVAVRMAVLAGILSIHEVQNKGPVDISVVTGDFTLPISAWYLRKMGFPIGNIVCCCNENNQFWELICNGQMRTDGLCLSTIVPEADVALPINLERLIADCGNDADTERYLASCCTGSMYPVSDCMHKQLREGLYASVISSDRVETTIPNVYKTHDYIMAPASALAYSGLMDYRSKTGISRSALVICDKCPVCEAETVAKLMDIPVSELKRII